VEKGNTLASVEKTISINTSTILGWSLPHSSVILPHKELERFAVNGSITSLATIFRNISSLFPRGENERFVELMWYRFIEDWCHRGS